MKKFKRFKRGATSFYIVAFSTLILVIIAASFATVMISEVTRTSNDDLSQSAYDSALAGVEDAKLAYANYQRCVAANPSLLTTQRPTGIVEGENTVNCNNIVYWVNSGDCDMVAKMLGRQYDDEGVFITETTGARSGISMQQYYTCVKIATVLDDYRANLTDDNNVRVVKVQFSDANASNIVKVKLSWYMRNETETANFANYDTSASPSRVSFYPVGEKRPATPPTIALQLIQTSGSFRLGGFTNDASDGAGLGLNGISASGQTDRATMFFVPAGVDCANLSGSECNSRNDVAKTFAKNENVVEGNYQGIYDESLNVNVLTKEQVVKTNDQSISNLPYVVYCGDSTTAFMCSVDIELPDPIQQGGAMRSDDTFMFLVTLPYGEPETDFALQFFREDSVAHIKDTQITIDSTGRANDLYRRVETRLESSDTAFPYTYYAMELFGDSASTINKDMTVTCENNFYDNGTNVVWTAGGSSGGFGALSDSKGCS